MAKYNSAVYLVKDLKNIKYYVGSHKDASAVLDGSYTSSSEPLNAAITENGIENFEFSVLKGGLHRQDAFQIEKNLLSALEVESDDKSYNQTETVLAPKEFWLWKMFRKVVTNSENELNEWVNSVREFLKGKKKESKEGNDFRFESQLGNFLEHGFDAYAEEGDRQGYDDPSVHNWEKQVDLLKVQLSNNIERELFIKQNKYSILKAAFEASDDIVVQQIEFIMQMKRAENEMAYIEEQKVLAEEGKGWYLMLHEALHDGFQDGSKRKLEELNAKYDLS